MREIDTGSRLRSAGIDPSSDPSAAYTNVLAPMSTALRLERLQVARERLAGAEADEQQRPTTTPTASAADDHSRPAAPALPPKPLSLPAVVREHERLEVPAAGHPES